MKLLRRLIALLWSFLAKRSAQQYRPELHYMRGPGPRSLAKATTRSEHDS
jgi:hypothetical protein